MSRSRVYGSEGQVAISSFTSVDWSDSKFISQVVSSVSIVKVFILTEVIGFRLLILVSLLLKRRVKAQGFADFKISQDEH